MHNQRALIWILVRVPTVLSIVLWGSSCGSPTATVACPSCDDGLACTRDSRPGDASDCTRGCVFVPITTCVNDDGCCPAGCGPATDNDCSTTCGNGTVENGETCDGNCPTACNDGDVCTTDTLVGSAASCSAECSYVRITACTGGDGCCPPGCDQTNDSDCSPGQCTGSTSQPCSIQNGAGTQTRVCNTGVWSDWGACTVVSCDGGHTQSENTCVAFSGQTFYVATSGSDSTGDGSSSKPWASLYKACSSVSAANSLILMAAGTYTETAQCVLAEGVSVEGANTTPPTTIINSTVAFDTGYGKYLLLLSSDTEGSDGNQSISYLRMVGNMVGLAAILVEQRSNVSIHHCELEDFFTLGITFIGADYWTDNRATVYSTGNSVHDCKITNCADYPGSGKDPTGWGRGNIEAGSQRGLEIYNNEIIQEDRGADNNGYCIKYTGDGYLEGLKIYNNTIVKPPYDGSTWDFAIELWNNRGGTEIYNNIIQGALDFGGGGGTNNDEAGYGFMAKVHDNYIGQPSFRSHEENGIYLERNIIGGTYIYNNHFQNLSKAVVTYPISGDVCQDIYFYYNIVDGIQSLPEDGGNGFVLSGSAAHSNIQCINNVFNAHSSSNPSGYGIYFNCSGSGTNLVARNNIIAGFVYNPIYVNASGPLSSCYFQNNLFYDNGTDSIAFGKTPSAPFANSNLAPANPMFVSSTDFHLQGTSPARDAGIRITSPSIATDYDDNPIGDPPTVGVYDY